MPDWLIITLCVIGGIVGLYLICAITCLIFVKIFSVKIKSSNNALNVLIHQRYELASKVILLLEENGIKVSEENKKGVEKLERIDNFQALEKNDRNDRINIFSHSMAEMMTSIKNNSAVIGDDVANNLIKDYRDIEDLYRQKSSVYNADVIGYNYWICTPLIKWITKLFRKHKKDLVI